MDIVAFADEHVDGAAAVLAERHAAHLAVEPLLPHRTDFRQQVENGREDATGAVAIDGGEVVGYLVGKRREDFLGPHVSSFVAGHALRDPELVRDLYASAAARWVEDGLTRHFVFVPAMRELVDPWLRLCFGISAALAARETAPEQMRSGEVVVRPAAPEDAPVAVTDPAERGSGAGVALTAFALRWARENGFETMTTDWRMSNLLASRFWPRRGFRETFLRLYRSIP